MKSYCAKFLLISFFTIVYVVLMQAHSIAQPAASINDTQTKNAADDKIESFLKRNMFIKVNVSSNKIFVGEPVMALYKFYTSVNGQAIVLKQPAFSGCSVNELNFDETPQTEALNGHAYTSFIVRKVQLTPVEAGTLSMGTATVSNHIEIPDNDNAFLTHKYDISISNVPVSVEVSALPDKNKPADFYGIIGSFTISVSVADKKIAAGENDHLIITIKGAGNLDAINKPVVIWPQGTEHFDGSDSQHIDQTNFPISGDRIFDIPFIGKKEGTVVIPAIGFSYFNSATKDYQTINTNSIAVTFTKAVLTKNAFTNVISYDVSNRKYLWIVGVIALVAGLIGFINYQRNKNQLKKKETVQTVTPAPVFEPEVKFRFKTDFSRYWNELESLTDAKLFFAKAKELLLNAVKETTDTTHHSEAFLLAALKQKVNDDLYKKVFTLLDVCDAKMYAPFETETDLHMHFNEVKNVIEELQKES